MSQFVSIFVLGHGWIPDIDWINCRWLQKVKHLQYYLCEHLLYGVFIQCMQLLNYILLNEQRTIWHERKYSYHLKIYSYRLKISYFSTACNIMWGFISCYIKTQLRKLVHIAIHFSLGVDGGWYLICIKFEKLTHVSSCSSWFSFPSKGEHSICDPIQPDAHYRCCVGSLARPSTGPVSHQERRDHSPNSAPLQSSRLRPTSVLGPRLPSTRTHGGKWCVITRLQVEKNHNVFIMLPSSVN